MPPILLDRTVRKSMTQVGDEQMMSRLEASGLAREISTPHIPAERWDRAPSTKLFSCLVGELFDDLKSGCRLANAIEEDLIRRGWPAGIIYGSEADLIERFDVGHAVVRQAVRVLEVRGSARMRRGPKGGLQVLRPSKAQSVELAAEYALLLGVQAEQIDAAQRLIEQVKTRLARCLRQTGNESSHELRQIIEIGMPFFEELLHTTRRFAQSSEGLWSGSRKRPLFHQSRAGQIARRLMTECTPQEWIRGTRLGSMLDLCDRYRIDRSVLRQAIRILESAGIAATLTGRGHGLITQAPQFSSVCRLISCHFAAHGLSAGAAVELFHWFSVEAVAEAAKLAADIDIERINRVLDRTNETELLTVLAEIEDGLFSTLKNPLIELFLRSTVAFPSWGGSACEDPTTTNKIYLVETRNVVAAIARRDSAGAAAAQDLRHRRLLAVASWCNREPSAHSN